MVSSDIFEQINQIIIQYIDEIDQGERKVGKILLPEQLKKIFDFGLDQSLIGDENHPHNKKLEDIIQQILDLSPATQSKFFANQLYAGADRIGIIGDRLATLLNTSLATYEVSPLFTLMEQEIFSVWGDKIGWTKGTYQGLMLSGGSLSNLYAIHCARSKVNPIINEVGNENSHIYDVYMSDQAHYSFTKAMMVMGMGKQHCIQIPTTEKGEMIVERLQHAIEQSYQKGHTPLMVVATAGTTVIGAFDNVQQISQICDQHKIWLHVDAAWGGATLISHHHQDLVSNIGYADSIVINAHKMLRAPQQCSLFFVHDPILLQQTNSLNADYLFHDDDYSLNNTGDNYIQCARKVDSLKLRLMMKYYGIDEMGNWVDTAISNAQYMYSQLTAHKNFVVYTVQSYANVCFWCIPQHLAQKIVTITDIQQYADEINTFTIQLKELMLREGKMMINYQPIKGYPNAFRMVFINPALQHEDIDEIIETFEVNCGLLEHHHLEIHLEQLITEGVK